LSHQPRIVFAGTPEFAATYLSALIEAGFLPVAVYTQPDRRSGRGKKIAPSAVKQVAQAQGIEVFQPLNFKQPQDVEQLRQLKPDLLIVVAYGLLLPQTVLDIPKHGCINAHASLLPKWRGAAPIQRAIEAGDKDSGVCLMQMDKGLDTGAVLARTSVSIGNLNSAELHQLLADKGAQLMVENLPSIVDGTISPKAQDDSLASYAHKLNKADALINWQLDAVQILRQIKAYNPWPVSQFNFQDKMIRVWDAELSMSQTASEAGTVVSSSKDGIEVATGEGKGVGKENGIIKLTSLQFPGKKALTVAQILQGNPDLFQPGSKLF